VDSFGAFDSMVSMSSTQMVAPTLIEQHADYQRVRQAIAFLAEHWREQPELSALARHLDLSESHLHQLFSRWAGVSPKRFVQSLTKAHAKALLRQHTVLDTAHAVGLSGPSRLHDLMVVHEAVTPGEYQRRGAGLQVSWGVHPSPFGQVLLAITTRGVCFVAFFDSLEEQAQVQADLVHEWGAAQLIHAPSATQPWAERIFGAATPAASADALSGPEPRQPPLRLLLKGSPFQLQVWEALLRLPPGHVCTYASLAASMGRPSATRAVASAVARNQIGWLIPCHRVIRSTGEVHDYRWGGLRKRAILAWEQGNQTASAGSDLT
jgi:AraC family transcriptional regulator of adaptative response/methylated-DNA-[protein]-cysteine methyltransferase